MNNIEKAPMHATEKLWRPADATVSLAQREASGTKKPEDVYDTTKLMGAQDEKEGIE